MEFKEHFDFCNESYVVEKTIEVVVEIAGSSETIRIEALKDLRDGHYSTHAYKKENVTLQPTYPQTGNSFDRTPLDMSIWISYDLPWTHTDSADAAIVRAVGFLSERCS